MMSTSTNIPKIARPVTAKIQSVLMDGRRAGWPSNSITLVLTSAVKGGREVPSGGCVVLAALVVALVLKVVESVVLKVVLLLSVVEVALVEDALSGIVRRKTKSQEEDDLPSTRSS